VKCRSECSCNRQNTASCQWISCATTRSGQETDPFTYFRSPLKYGLACTDPLACVWMYSCPPGRQYGAGFMGASVWGAFCGVVHSWYWPLWLCVAVVPNQTLWPISVLYLPQVGTFVLGFCSILYNIICTSSGELNSKRIVVYGMRYWYSISVRLSVCLSVTFRYQMKTA